MVLMITILAFPTSLITFAETNRLSQKYWNDYYVSRIIMTIGDSMMYVDGGAVETESPASIDDSEGNCLLERGKTAHQIFVF